MSYCTRQVAASFSRAGTTYSRAARIQRRAAFDCADAVPLGHYPVTVEIGTGCGVLTDFLRPHVMWDTYIGCDIAPGMLAAMPRPCGGEHLVVADGEEVPLHPGQADLLVSASTMQWYRDPARSIPANLRLLRPGGRFSFVIFVAGTLAELAQVSRETGFGHVVPMRDAQEYEWIISGTPGVTCQTRVWDAQMRYPSVRDFLRELKRTGVTGAGAGRAFSRSRYTAFCRRYEELCGGGTEVVASWRMLFVSGVFAGAPQG